MGSQQTDSKHVRWRRVVIGGAVANSIEAVIMHPLDSLKTRYQLQTGQGQSIVQMLRDMGGAEGKQMGRGFLHLWRGSLPAILMQFPRGAWKFGINGASEKVLRDMHASATTAGVLGGLVAGSTESIIITPFELLKVRLQSSHFNTAYRHTGDALRKLVLAQPITTLWQGLTATAVRNGLWNAAYFGVIRFAQAKFPNRTPLLDFAMGCGAGAFGACFSNPFDVAKSRIQAQAQNLLPGGHKRSLLPTILHIAHTEGPLALYKGMVPKLLRLGPGGGILLATYEAVGQWIH